MKYLVIFLSLALVGCGAEAEEEQTPHDLMQEILEEQEAFVTDYEEKAPPSIGSQKEMLLGTWYMETNDVEIILSKDRYISYIDGRKGWDQDWELSSGTELTDDNVDDNGSYLYVLMEETKEVFYSIEIIELTESNMHGLKIGSSGDGPNDHIDWSRTKPDYEALELDKENQLEE